MAKKRRGWEETAAGKSKGIKSDGSPRPRGVDTGEEGEGASMRVHCERAERKRKCGCNTGSGTVVEGREEREETGGSVIAHVWKLGGYTGRGGYARQTG